MLIDGLPSPERVFASRQAGSRIEAVCRVRFRGKLGFDIELWADTIFRLESSDRVAELFSDDYDGNGHR